MELLLWKQTLEDQPKGLIRQRHISRKTMPEKKTFKHFFVYVSAFSLNLSAEDTESWFSSMPLLGKTSNKMKPYAGFTTVFTT